MNEQTLNYLEEYKKENPRYSGISNDKLYGVLKDRRVDVPEDSGLNEMFKAPTSQYSDKEDMNSLQKMSDWFIDENSSAWMRAAYNNSLTGMTEEMITGKKRYDLDDYDPGIIEDVFSTALSFLMPLDIATMFVGGSVGAKIAAPMIKGVQKKAGIALTGAGFKSMEGLSMAQKMLVGATRQAPALGLYEGAIGGVQA